MHKLLADVTLVAALRKTPAFVDIHVVAVTGMNEWRKNAKVGNNTIEMRHNSKKTLLKVLNILVACIF